MIKSHYYLVMFILSGQIILAQNTPEEFLEAYQKRIKLERINDVYIPVDVNEAMVELDRLTDPKVVQNLKFASEDTVASKLHFSLGRWMQIHWGLEEGSRLSHYFKTKGLSFPDDMMDLLIRCWHRHINNSPLEEHQLIGNYIKKRQEEFNRRKVEFLPIPTPKKS